MLPFLWIGYPGSYGFTGVADILSGETSPSGHLSVTYAVDSTSSPAMMNYGNIYYTNGTDDSDSMYVVEAEGIYIGYKYYETRYSDLITGDGNADSTAGSSTGEAWSYEDEVTYSFGYGLSYTEFRQTLDAVEMTEDSITVTVTIANVGDVAGKDVAQIYIQTPYTDYDREYLVEKSAVQLIDYAKTDVLEPGESQTLTITFDKSDFASYDSNGAGTYIMDAGDYYLALGNGAHDALNNILAAQGYTTEDGMDYDGDAALTYTWNQEELDTTTYSVSSTGAEITNQLEDMDLNYRVVLASGTAIVLIVIQQVLYHKLGDQLWLGVLYPAVSVLLAVAAVIFIGARVESAAMILASELEAGNAAASSALLQSFIGIGCFIAGILAVGIAGCFRQEATT